MTKFMKFVPNILSISRIIAASILFTFNDFYDTTFLCIYIFCAATDFFDGKIARKYHCESKLGAALDSIGDGMTYLPLLKILVVQKAVPNWIVIWLIVDIGLALIAATIALVKFKKFFFSHTYIGKLLGVVIFVLPIMVQFMPVIAWVAVIVLNATINVAEIIYINAVSKEPQDVLTIFHVNKNLDK